MFHRSNNKIKNYIFCLFSPFIKHPLEKEQLMKGIHDGEDKSLIVLSAHLLTKEKAIENAKYHCKYQKRPSDDYWLIEVDMSNAEYQKIMPQCSYVTLEFLNTFKNHIRSLTNGKGEKFNFTAECEEKTKKTVGKPS